MHRLFRLSIEPTSLRGFLFLCLVLVPNITAYALNDEVDLTLDVSVELTEEKSPKSVTGHLSIKAWQTSPCFYLGYNDPLYGTYNKLSQRMGMVDARSSQAAPIGGSTLIRKASHDFQYVRGYVIQLPQTRIGEEISIEFVSTKPRYGSDHSDQWVFYDFYPQPMEKCPVAGEDGSSISKRSGMYGRMQITPVKDWELVIGNDTDKNHLVNEFNFALLRGFRRHSFSALQKNVNIYYRNDDFLRLVPTIHQSLSTLVEWLGPQQNKNLSVIEGFQFERDDLDGFLVLNKPQQTTWNNLQKDWMNWIHWMLVHLLGRQWFGGEIARSSLDDEWLFRGTAEFLTFEVLSQFETRFDLFNLHEGAYALLDLNYREFMDISAMTLYQQAPLTVLTTEDNHSALRFFLQHSMTSLRHAIMLRELRTRIGNSSLRKIFREASSKWRHKILTPQKFYEDLYRETEASNQGLLKDIFHQWWHTAEWPDYELTEFQFSQEKDNSWLTYVRAVEKNGIELPTTITITDESGAKTRSWLHQEKKSSGFSSQIKTLFRPVKATLDEERAGFDTNRYNNSSNWPRLTFFPGNARGVPDDGYTYVWFLYPFRRPNQPWSLAIQTSLYRYINAPTTLGLETELGPRHRTAFDFRQLIRYTPFMIDGFFSTRQNIYGSRVYEYAQGITTPITQVAGISPRFGLALRGRAIAGVEQSFHGTYALNTTVTPFGESRFIGFLLRGEYEQAPKQANIDFQYERRFLIGETYFHLFPGIDYTLRFFRGEITTQGMVPDQYLFRPSDTAESRLRFELGEIKNAQKIYAIGNDFYFPLKLGLNDVGPFASSRIKGRTFYDIGSDIKEHHIYRGAGAGIESPLGGEVTGVGKISISKMSLLGILYSSKDSEASYRPKLLFSLGADF